MREDRAYVFFFDAAAVRGEDLLAMASAKGKSDIDATFIPVFPVHTFRGEIVDTKPFVECLEAESIAAIKEWAAGLTDRS